MSAFAIEACIMLAFVYLAGCAAGCWLHRSLN